MVPAGIHAQRPSLARPTAATTAAQSRRAGSQEVLNATLKLSSPATREFWEIPILYEDEHLLALDKPAGLLLLADPADSARPCLMDLLHAGIAARKPWAREAGRSWLKHAHRPDEEASGVVLLAKSKAVLASLQDWFGAERPGRTYVALVQGTPLEDPFEVEAAIAPHPDRERIMRVDPRQGKHCRTAGATLERFSRWTLLRCQALTDRPHQLRLHLRYIRLPIVGDGAYGGRPLLLSRLKPGYRLKPEAEERPLFGRTALHAESLVFPHPATGQSLTITAPWPKEFTVALKYLRRYAANAPLGQPLLP